MDYHQAYPDLRVVYTCVVGGYDRLYAPLVKDPKLRYIVFTDDSKLVAPGWEVRLFKPGTDLPPSLANRHCKLFPWKYIPEATSSIYIDGNIRILSSLSRLFDLLDDGYDIALFRHPERNFVSEEIEACLSRQKVRNRDVLKAELKALHDLGFVDRGRLTENSVIVRSHRSADLCVAMKNWWDFVRAYSGRDQISLHHCLTDAEVKKIVLPFSFREPNRFFDIYPHYSDHKTWAKKIYAHSSARKSEGALMYLKFRMIRKITRTLGL